jgi:hypothetical protein
VLAGLRSRLTYANIVATLALFVALGGSAYGALRLPKNSVGSNQISSGAVGSRQLRNGGVTNPKLAVGAVTARNVVRGSLTGAQIDAATLGTVPSATRASSADSATTATTATYATHATSADSATTATTATNATHATSADSATTATTATNATHATSADSATNATDTAELGGVSASSYLTASDIASVSVDAEAVEVQEHGGASAAYSSFVVGPGVYCIGLPFRPAGGAVTLSGDDSGFPVAYISYSTSDIATDCGPAGNWKAVITTYNEAGGTITGEAFTAIFY